MDVRSIWMVCPMMSMWTGEDPVPPMGSRVMVTMNNMGTGEVVGYYMAKGEDNNAYTGVVVLLDTPPIWYLEQNSGCRLVWVFGREVRNVPR